MHHLLARAAGAAALVFLSVGVASAQSSDELAYEQALDAVMENVGDPAQSFAFVEAATRVGDLRGAVTSLERILLIQPGLANIQLELGVLYLRLGNAGLGRYHIRQALRSPNVPSAVRARAEAYLSESTAQTKRNFFYGSLYSGYRNHSNANAGPDSPFVSVLDPFTGRPVQGELSADALERSDGVLEFGTGLAHIYAFRAGGRASWVSRLNVNSSRYNDLDVLDGFGWRVETGPQIVWLSSPEARWSLRFFAAAADDSLDGEDFLEASGAGIELQRAGGGSSTTQLRVQTLDNDFDDRFNEAGEPELIVSDRSGDYLSTDFVQYWQRGRMQWGLLLNAESADTAGTYQSYSRYGAGASARWFFGENGAGSRWSLFATLMQRNTDYDAPFALVNPDLAREDDRFDARIGAEVGLGRTLALQVVGGYVKNDSNLPNFTYNDTTASVFLNWRF